VLYVHHIAQWKANFEDEGNRYQTLKISGHRKQKGNPNDDWSQYVEEYFVKGH